MPKGAPGRWVVVPARRSTDSSAVGRARIILIVLIITCLTGVVALIATFTKGEQVIDFSHVDPQGQAIADATAYQAMTGTKILVPSTESFDPASAVAPYPRFEGERDEVAVKLPYPVKNVSWTGFDLNRFGGENGLEFEVHRYLLVPDMTDYLERGGFNPDGTRIEDSGEGASGSGESEEETPAEDEDAATEEEAPAEEEDLTGQELLIEQGIRPYVLSVTVLLTDEGPRLAAAPSLEPWTDATAEPAGTSDYSNYSQSEADITTSTARQIGRWAVAYAEDDRETLLEITGDPDVNHEYRGLGGFQVPEGDGTVRILSAINVNEGDVLARVRVLLEDTNTIVENDNEQPFRTYVDYDVIVSNPTAATPNIVAWGPAGTAATLSAYDNAVTPE